MQWYYEKDGTRVGPVADAELDNLARSGVVRADTLVWHDGMSDWKPLGEMRPSPPPSLPPVLPSAAATAPGEAPCCECGRPFPKEDMISYQNLWVCASCKAVFFQKVQEGATIATSNIWRDRKVLVMGLNATLPDRCVKCNEPTPGRRLKRKLYWNPPGFYVALVVLFIVCKLIGLIICAVVSAIWGKRATIEVGLCERHARFRTRAIIGAWLALSLGIGCFVLAGATSTWGWIIPGAILFISGIIIGPTLARVVYAKKIDDEHIRLAGPGPKFLDEFPEWKG